MKVSYDVFNRTEPTEIYIAKPGQRLIGLLPGVKEETAYVELKLNNANTLEFTVDRNLNGEVNPFYEYVETHYELYVKNIGWFKINQTPEIQSDGEVETKTVSAESLEIELQQYDLVNFEINTGSESSKEMLATDNTYPIDDFTMFRDQVKFYRDASNIEALSEYFRSHNYSTVAHLESCLFDYPDILSSWRIDIVYSSFDNAIDSAVAERTRAGKPTSALEQYVGRVKTKQVAVTLMKTFPELYHYVHITVDRADAFDSSITYTIQQVIDRETARQNELSFMYLVLHEHGWTVGEVDDYVDPSSSISADREYLKNRIGKFEVDSQDIYSFLTQDASEYYRCVFDFDTENYKVNAYKIESIGEDTNIILSFHNIQNSITRSSDQDLYTVLHVEGDEDLDPSEANFGEDVIEDLSYFMNTAHFPQALITKYNAWVAYREQQRPTYIQKSKDYRNQLDKCTEIYERVPLDGSDVDQYDTFTDGELANEKANYQAQIAGYESFYVDENGNFDIDLMRRVAPQDYANYILIKNQIIPNIDIAIYNRGVDTAEDEREYLDGYKYDFNTYGNSYGVAELENQKTILSNAMKSLERRGYNRQPASGDEYATKQYQLYQKYKTAYNQCNTALTQRNNQYNSANNTLDSIASEMESIRSNADKSNSRWGFTATELKLLDKYYIHTDYKNENIVVTDVDTNDQIVNKAYELFQNAQDELYANSHPQWTWATTQDNLLLIPEFKLWHRPLDIGNFIRVTLREDDAWLTGTPYMATEAADHSLQVKLRVIRIGFNPFLLEQTIDIDFSNMIKYKSKRNDFIDILGLGGGTGKNQISTNWGTTSSRDTVNVDTNLIMKIINNGTFSGYMGTYVGGAEAAAISAVSGSIGTIVAEQIEACTINVDQITGNTAQFQELFSTYIGADYLVADILRASQASIADLSAEVITVGRDGITQITSDTIQTANINVDQITGTSADFQDLFSEKIGSNYLITEILEADDGYIANLTSEIITVGHDDITQITTDTIRTANINASKIVGTEGDFQLLSSHILSSDQANIKSLIANTVSAGEGIVFNLTSANTTLDNALIHNVIASSIAVNELAAGTITLTDSMKIVSENGSLLMNGSVLQIMGEDERGNQYVGVQLGYDTNEQPSLILRNSEGATVLTPSGITSDAVADGLIVNQMVHDGTLSKSKMGFPIVDTNQDGTVNISLIKDGTGGNFGVEYSTFKTATQEAIEASSYVLYIDTPRGKNIRGGNVTLSAKLYKNGVDVTDDWDADYFIWTRHSLDSIGDTAWNNAHSTGAKSITVTSSDVAIEADFECSFEANNVSVGS